MDWGKDTRSATSKLNPTRLVKTSFIFLVLASASLFLGACAQGQIKVPGGTIYVGGRPPVQRPMHTNGGHHQGGHPGMHLGQNPEQAGQERPIIKGQNDYYSRTTWKNEYAPQVQIQVNGRPLDASDETLKGQIHEWAIQWFKEHNNTPPTDQQATEEAEKIRGKGMVRVRLGNHRPDPVLVSREKVDPSQVSEQDRAEFQKRAIEQFRQTGQNGIITNGKFYNN